MISKAGLYAYGLVGSRPQPLDILGIDKINKVYPVEGREMCLIVSAIDIPAFANQVKQVFSALTKTPEAAQNGTKALLQAHEHVVATLMSDATVVPFKFGTILKDEKAASQMLLDYEETFQNLLAQLTGKVEWGLKVYADQQAFIKQRMQTEPILKDRQKDLEEKREKLSRGAAYLFERKMEEEFKGHVEGRLTEIAEGIFQELGKDAYEGKLNKTLPQTLTGKKKEMVLNAVYLVGREKVARFCKRGKRVMEKYRSMGLDLEVSGPWPPYSFTL